MYYLFALITVSIWAGNAVVSKLSTDVIAPGAMSFYRWFFAILLLTPFCLPVVIRRWSEIRPWLGKLAALAFLGMALNQSLGYYAAASTSATNMTLVSALIPLLSIMFSVPLLAQRLTWNALVGAVISLSGLVMMLTKGNPLMLVEQGISTGDALILLASIVYALYCVLLKRWNLTLSTWVAVYMQGAFALLFLMPMWLMSGDIAIPTEAWGLIAYASVFASVIAPWCWMQAISVLGASRAAMFMNLMPLITAGMAAALLNEHLTVYHLFGGGMVLSGVILAQSRIKLRKRNVVVAGA
ncbi:DMT family transporter [Parasalinivibrio latis]|uniref:DMT family transporter n=1 Tax=Parasalinivibrio latis TaxID=2952610 RepID=UPI0030E20910